MMDHRLLRAVLMLAVVAGPAAADCTPPAKLAAPHKRDRSAERLAAAQAKRERRQAKRLADRRVK